MMCKKAERCLHPVVIPAKLVLTKVGSGNPVDKPCTGFPIKLALGRDRVSGMTENQF